MNAAFANETVTEFVTVMIGGQLFGLPIGQVQDVFIVGDVTPVPLAPPDIAGVLNLRGRIITAIDMRAHIPKIGRGERRARAKFRPRERRRTRITWG